MPLPHFGRNFTLDRIIEIKSFCFEKENNEICKLYDNFIGHDTMKDGLLFFKKSILYKIEEMCETFESGYLKIINETYFGDELKSKKATFIENMKIDKNPHYSYTTGDEDYTVSFKCKCDITIKVDGEILLYERKLKLKKLNNYVK